MKTTRTFDLVKTRTSRQVAVRKTWAKFGLSKDDSKGAQDSTTIIAEEVTMRFIHADQGCVAEIIYSLHFLNLKFNFGNLK